MIANTLRPAAQVLDALQARLRTLRWRTEPAFHQVELFDVADLVFALETLLLSKNRVCVIVHDAIEFDHELRGTDLHVFTTRSVMLLLSDKVLGDRRAVAFGGAQNPGTYALADLVFPLVTGRLLENPTGVYGVPVRAEPMEIKGTDQGKAVGRSAFLVQLHLVGGEMRTPLGRTPIV